MVGSRLRMSRSTPDISETVEYAELLIHLMHIVQTYIFVILLHLR